jgi:hypothetical protein
MRFLRAIVRVEKGSKSIGVVLAEVVLGADLRPAPRDFKPRAFLTAVERRIATAQEN